jgi:hypothetical protein
MAHRSLGLGFSTTFLVLVGVVSAGCGEIKVGPMLVLASHMEGTLVDKDRHPVPNVRVERTWKWALNGKTGSHVSTTDAQGHFEFPKVTRFSLAGLLPVQPQVRLQITAHGPKGPVLLFEVNKDDYVDRSEMSGKPFNIVCRIDLEPGGSVGGYWGTVIEVK